ncbi:MAG: membrane dipeptidase [Pseudorhodoplanes sp.]|nr:membrane dipeptidase [Pseudorhodoplanes sp.]
MQTRTPQSPGFLIDGLQYCNWSEKIFRELKAGGVTAIHVTICYHENFRETVSNIVRWNGWFERFPDLIFHGRTGEDVRRAAREGRTAVFFGFQNPLPIEDDIGLVEICHTLGARFMQLSYNNQSLLASGCYEAHDTGITRMGREVIREMNRVGMVIDMSHSGERSTLEAIELSQRPIAITHANPASWHKVLRNKSDAVLRALAQGGGMLGLSLYPMHLAGGSNCTLQSFCEMAARTADLMGVEHIGIGSDLCQDQPDSVVEWMRVGRWTKHPESMAGTLGKPVFPQQPEWFRGNLDFGRIAAGLAGAGFAADEIDRIMGLNWLEFFDRSFGPASVAEPAATAIPVARMAGERS